MLKYDLEKHMFGIEKNLTWDRIRKDNLKWWKRKGTRDAKEKPSTKRRNYDIFLEDIYADTGLSIEELKDKVIGEVCCGPYGGIIEAYKIECKEKYFIDIFMEDFKDMKLVEWTDNSNFVNAPCEQIHLEDNTLDILYGYNSIDHGWDWKKSIDECLRISKKMFLMFDTKDEIDGDIHPQKISHTDVVEYIAQSKWKEKYKYVSVQAKYKDYGYYDTSFEWPETWVYVIK
jgi:hypothetical protein